MSRSVVPCPRDELVAVSRESMVVLGMIVIAVGVRVQQRRSADRRDQRRDEQYYQDALHRLSLWEARIMGQKFSWRDSVAASRQKLYRLPSRARLTRRCRC